MTIAIAKPQSFQVNRDLQSQFQELLHAMGFNYLGLPENLDSSWAQKESGWSNGTFIVRPYCYDDCYCGDVCTCRCSLPNFEHILSEFKMDWYKYPLRGATSNQSLTCRMISEWRLQFK